MPENDDKSTDAPAEPEAQAGDEEQLLAEWRVHLMLGNARKSAAVVAACVLALVLAYVAFGIWLTILGALMLFGSLSDWFLPVTYRLTTRGASYTNFVFRRRIAWDDVRSTYASDFGVKLSPFSRPTRLDRFRGIILRFAAGEGPGGRDEVIRIVKARAARRR
jgi:hypothetical protein